MAATSLTELPPELLDQIATYLPIARSVANLGRANKTLHAFVDKDGDAWKNFNTARFPSLLPNQSSSHKRTARTFTTLSKAWDRRAFVARYIEPHGNIRAFPGDKKLERWKRPRGQTIGFTPQLDCFEQIGSAERERKEILAFSAGAEICVRRRNTVRDGSEDVRWVVYLPLDALEGKDDVTSLHLLRPEDGALQDNDALELVVGTANGDLQLLNLFDDGAVDAPNSYFVTQGQPLRSSSVLQQTWKPTLLAANIGNDCVSLYEVDKNVEKISPTSSISIPRPPNGHRAYRAWSTNFLSQRNLAVGLGPSSEPIHIYSLTPSGIEKAPLRKYSLQNDIARTESEVTTPGAVKKSTSSVYPIVPLPALSNSEGINDSRIFLSGGHDGVIRLHDLRSNVEVEKTYIDPTDDSSIYSLLPRGQETLIAGTSRHSLLKVFDLRLGAKAYSYLDNDLNNPGHNRTKSGATKDWNLFLKPHSATYSGRGGGNNWARRSAESSIYSLATPSPCSPYVYAGVENAVLELAFTSVLDHHPDPVFFNNAKSDVRRASDRVQGFRTKEVLDLAMYDQTAEMMKLKTQRSLWETFRVRRDSSQLAEQTDDLAGMDERWKVVSA